MSDRSLELEHPTPPSPPAFESGKQEIGMLPVSMSARREHEYADLHPLISRIACGDRVAFRALFDATRAHLFAVSLQILRNRAEAEEALQDAFVRVWKNAASYGGNGPGYALSWVTAIIRNRSIEIVRRRGVDDGEWDAARFDTIADDASTPEQAALSAGDARALAICLARVESGQRAALLLAFYEGLSYSAVAQALARPLGTVKSQIRRGLASLKACLEAP